MSSIKDAIVRIGRSVRQVEASYLQNNKKKYKKPTPIALIEPIEDPLHHLKLTNDELTKYTPLITNNYRRKYYQSFLRPLQIPNLKTFEENRPDYNSNLAHDNWKRAKTSSNSHSNSKPSTSSNFTENRITFLQMMDLLIELTPRSLKLDPSTSAKYIQRVLTLQEEVNPLKLETQKYRFDELPKYPLPRAQSSPSTLSTASSPADPLVSDFQNYIYQLTHQKWIYENSSSLENGLIPDILLYTHNMDNTSLKPYRSVHTFNYLIHYFGYEKNQSSFARELLLVMNKDGHKPNIDTINNLLRMCRTHSHIRSLTSTYSVILKYLKLTKSLGLEINLTTWSRIYDLINNIFLKEIFIDKMNNINLPILRNMSFRILDDFMNTTKLCDEVIRFIENDLKFKNWRQDSILSNKVLRYELKNGGDLEKVLKTLFASSDRVIDEFTFQTIQHFIAYKSRGENDLWYMMKVYGLMKQHSIIPTTDTFIYMVDGVCKRRELHTIDKLMFLVRGLIHEEATLVLSLPTETKKIIISTGEIVEEGPQENFKIMRRLVGGPILNELEGRYLYENGFRWTKRDGTVAHKGKNMTDYHVLQTKSDVALLRNPFSSNEKQIWNEFKHKVINSTMSSLPTKEELQLIGRVVDVDHHPNTDRKEHSAKYVNVHKNRSVNAAFRHRLEKLHKGDTYVMEKMERRGLS